MVHTCACKLSLAESMIDSCLGLEETLQDIARHFTLKEWIQGPARTCHFLYAMELSNVDLTFEMQYLGPETNYSILITFTIPDLTS